MTTTQKKVLLQYYKKAYVENLMKGTSGNASIYDHSEKKVYITPSGFDHTIMTEDDIVEIDLNGNVLNGEKKPSSEWRMHVKIYEARPDFKAIIHTHSPYATAFAVANLKIPRILAEMVFWTDGEVPVSKYAPNGSTLLAEYVAETLKDRRTCLMQNHGVIAAGSSIEDAFLRASYIEDAARICSIAKNIGNISVI